MKSPGIAKAGAGLLLAGLLVGNVGQTHDSEVFDCEATARQERFVATAVEMGLSRKDSLVLYGLSGAESIDGVTGFAPAKDRRPTVARAIESVGASQFDSAFYVEVDIQNLGGLNAVLGHTGADDVYGRMARITEQHIESLRTDDHTCSFRHGGDEFSFVVVGAGNTQAQVEAALAAADREIRQYIKSEGLAKIEHPKHRGDKSKSGAGIVFGVSRIGGQDQLADVFSAADKVVEKKKM
ncbi:MAG: diguanylate cyclase domain-containing protein [Gammaproteobacteria bacterium]